MRHLLLLALVAALCSCSHIDEQDQLIYVKPQPAKRSVLLEDFTGQNCPNCPLGSDIIEQLQSDPDFGDRVIAVGIHGGPLGYKQTAGSSETGLATAVGDEYYDHWRLEYQPVGLIDRHGAVNYPDWIGRVKEELQTTSVVTMGVEAAVNGSQIDIAVTGECTDGTYKGKLQVWLLEDSIVAIQRMPNGSRDRSYMHHHVLRTPVNGTWGENVDMSEGQRQQHIMSMHIDPEWNKEHLSVVAFVYNDKGVEQTVKAKVMPAAD